MVWLLIYFIGAYISLAYLCYNGGIICDLSELAAIITLSLWWPLILLSLPFIAIYWWLFDKNKKVL